MSVKKTQYKDQFPTLGICKQNGETGRGNTYLVKTEKKPSDLISDGFLTSAPGGQVSIK
ncbi:MAG: hypothetical protein JWP78_341 [Mucilaginibacter sp.]|nr:hypothetical protein [Mucilaginibacter sp.]